MLYRNYIAKALHAAITYVRRMLLARILVHVSVSHRTRARARNTILNCVRTKYRRTCIKLALPSHHKQIGYTTAALAKNSYT